MGERRSDDRERPIGSDLRATDRSRLRRKRERGSYQRTTVEEILDDALICHVGLDPGPGPTVQPMAFARIGDHLYLHGAPGNGLLRALAGGADACVTATVVDGLVLARSAFHHSFNYRSVVLFGQGTPVTAEDEQRAASEALVEHVLPGRSADARPPSELELRATLIVRFPIDEGSAKIRTGPPLDEESDLDLAIWAGQVPLRTVAEAPVADGAGRAVQLPDYVRTGPLARPGHVPPSGVDGTAAAVGLDHVQLAMPAGQESAARGFYEQVLGIPEVPKPPELAARGGAWFEAPSLKVHLGVEEPFAPARKAHPGLVVDGLDELVARLEAFGHRVRAEPLGDRNRVYVDDPFGNRLELLERIAD